MKRRKHFKILPEADLQANTSLLIQLFIEVTLLQILDIKIIDLPALSSIKGQVVAHNSSQKNNIIKNSCLQSGLISALQTYSPICLCGVSMWTYNRHLVFSVQAMAADIHPSGRLYLKCPLPHLRTTPFSSGFYQRLGSDVNYFCLFFLSPPIANPISNCFKVYSDLWTTLVPLLMQLSLTNHHHLEPEYLQPSPYRLINYLLVTPTMNF